MKNLYTALAKAKMQFSHPVLDKQNPHFRNRYASLSSVMDACKQGLEANGLIIVQSIGQSDEQPNTIIFNTTIFHVPSGEDTCISFPLQFQQGNMQSLGSAITYARRYQLSTILGLIAEEDDDGNATAPRPQEQKTPYVAVKNLDPGGTTTISEKQAKRLFAIAMSKGFSKDSLQAFLKNRYGITKSSQILWIKYDEVIREIEKGPGSDFEPIIDEDGVPF